MQAMFMVSNSDVMGDDPGLQSVATAMATSCLRNRSIGGALVSRKRVESAGQDHGDRAGF